MKTKQKRLVAQDGFMTIPEVMAFYSVSRPTVYKLMGKGRLPFTVIGCQRRIPRSAVIKLAEERMELATP